jgi:hypothetical protein
MASFQAEHGAGTSNLLSRPPLPTFTFPQEPWEMVARLQENHYLTHTAVDALIRMTEKRHAECKASMFSELCMALPDADRSVLERVCLSKCSAGSMLFPKLHSRHLREKAWMEQTKYHAAEPKKRILGINPKTGEEDYVVEVGVAHDHRLSDPTSQSHHRVGGHAR